MYENWDDDYSAQTNLSSAPTSYQNTYVNRNKPNWRDQNNFNSQPQRNRQDRYSAPSRSGQMSTQRWSNNRQQENETSDSTWNSSNWDSVDPQSTNKIQDTITIPGNQVGRIIGKIDRIFDILKRTYFKIFRVHYDKYNIC